MALYSVKPVGTKAVPIYPVVPLEHAPPPIGQLAPGQIASVVHANDNDGELVISTPTLAGFVAAPAVKKQPFIAIDMYRGEFGGKPPIANIVAWPELSVLILKATDGSSYNTTWFNTYWDAVRRLGAPRYGDTLFRAAYHFLRYGPGASSATAQADYYLKTIDRAGGWAAGDVVPIVDVEDGNENTAAGRKQAAASAQQVIDYTSAFAERINQVHGRPPILYGGSSIRARGITSHMGCVKVWVARYTSTLPGTKTYKKMGWALEDVWGWQYGGTSPEQRARLVGYPKDVPGVPKQLDLSVIFADTYADLLVVPL